MRVHVTQPLPEPSTRELLGGHDVTIGRRGATDAERLAVVGSIDALLSTPADPVDETYLAEAPRLRIVANCAVGTDNIDLDACRRRGIVVTNTPDLLTEATADLAFALILAVTRRLREGEALVRSGLWDGWKPLELLGTGLQGKTLGIFGAGRIGSAVAARGRAFGMDVLLVTSRDPADAFEALLARSDVLSIHAPLTPATRGRFGDAELLRLKRGAILVNTSRGPLVREDALVRALRSGHLGGAGLDVFEREPAVHADLLGRDDVVLLPHLGSATGETRLAMARRACDEIARFFRGEPPRSRVV